jgi:hypothetical protein
VNISFKLDADLANAIDAEAAKMNSERPGLAVTRTAIIRMALNDWLKARGRPRRK